MLTEEFRPINGFPNYSVSNFGRVVNTKFGNEKALCDTGDGYYKVDLYNNAKRTTKKVHRLVADAFLPPDPGRKEINHKDGDKKNNCVDNLERCTGKENMQHAFKTGLCTPNYGNLRRDAMKGKKNPNAGNQKKIKVLETNRVYKSIAACSRYTHFSDRRICECAKCKKAYRGYHFEYV